MSLEPDFDLNAQDAKNTPPVPEPADQEELVPVGRYNALLAEAQAVAERLDAMTAERDRLSIQVAELQGRLDLLVFGVPGIGGPGAAGGLTGSGGPGAAGGQENQQP